MKRKLIAGVLALALVATAFAVVSAQTNSGGPAPMAIGGRLGGSCGMSQLTDEEREEIRQQMQEYRQELFDEYGILCPAGPQFTGAEGNGPRGPMGLQMHGFGGGRRFCESTSNPPNLKQ